MNMRFLRAAVLVTVVFVTGNYGPIGSAIGLAAAGLLMWCFAASEFGAAAGMTVDEGLNAGQLLELVNDDGIPDTALVYLPTHAGLEPVTDFIVARVNGQIAVIVSR